MSVFLVFLGGAIGAVIRYLVTLYIPLSIVLWLVNGLGSFLMGVLQAYFSSKDRPKWKLFLTTGVLGSFTTFSAFSAQWFDLIESSFLMGTMYMIGMTLFCVFVAAIGFSLLRNSGGRG